MVFWKPKGRDYIAEDGRKILKEKLKKLNVIM
jgi:hypothetical protein